MCSQKHTGMSSPHLQHWVHTILTKKKKSSLSQVKAPERHGVHNPELAFLLFKSYPTRGRWLINRCYGQKQHWGTCKRSHRAKWGSGGSVQTCLSVTPTKRITRKEGYQAMAIRLTHASQKGAPTPTSSHTQSRTATGGRPCWVRDPQDPTNLPSATHLWVVFDFLCEDTRASHSPGSQPDLPFITSSDSPPLNSNFGDSALG